MGAQGSVAIVGGRGFLGQALYGQLARQSIAAWIVGRPSQVEMNGNPYEYRSSVPSLEWAIRGASAVVHLATVTTPAIGAADPQLEVENVRFTLSLLDACARQAIEHLVFCSSGGTLYGPIREPVDEQHPAHPVCAYGITKLACEQYIRLYAEQTSSHATVLRVTNPYGGQQRKKGDQGVLPFIINSLIKGKEIHLFGNTTRDYIYIDDVARAFQLALEKPDGFQIYNIATGVGVALVDLVHLVARLIDRRPRISMGELHAFDVPFSVLKNGKAQRALGWSPQHPIEEGIKLCLRDCSPVV